MLCVSLTEIGIWLMVNFIKNIHTQTHICHMPIGKCFIFWLSWDMDPYIRARDGQKGKFAKLCFLHWLLPRDGERDPANLSPGSSVLHSGNRQR